MGTRGSWGYQSRRTAYFYSMKPFCQWALEKRAPPHFMRTTECPGEEIFKSHCQGQPPEHVTLPRLQEERRHGSRKNGPTAIQPQLTAASFAFLPREDTPLPQAFLLLWRKQPSEGPPLGTQKVCTVPSLPAIWGHGGGGNKVTFQRFLVPQRKASAAISWAYSSFTSLLPEPAFLPPGVPCCHRPQTQPQEHIYPVASACPSHCITGIQHPSWPFA